MKKTFVIAISALLLSDISNAQQREDMNLKGERARIRQGVKSGEITRGEAAKIREKENELRNAKRAAKADGVINKQERKEIAKEDRQLDRTIHRTKHNNKRRK